ncbi:hypothetical protein C7444_10728 [Sphaerotilus hippei]|uniref:Imelysin-like domain-containing protein n=1 Tax=Sphaerotilus hippei TaxID=744406 RepID=A0A318H346_9BURK|nr:imelysin family protein [Sphaerotilus hippei]PXW96122.1 hypothetical protein C7444_10728 [Sphaerotilus hippei]
MNLPPIVHLPSRRRATRTLLGATLALALPRLAGAASRDLVTPLYGADGFVRCLWQFVCVPAAGDFRREAEALATALTPAQATAGEAGEHLLRAGRYAWTRTLPAWLRLASVATGPLIERRSLRALDFQPTRPELIGRAVAQAAAGPLDEPAMERIGSPAKGLPALEHLLWSSADEFPREPALFHYLASVARDLAREARAIEAAWQARLDAELDEDTVIAGMAEFINQLLGAVEGLRWRDIEHPLRAASPTKQPYPRQRSGQTAQAWAAAWQTLRELCLTPSVWPEPGQDRVPLGLYLRSIGLLQVADRLDALVDQTDRLMQGLTPRDRPDRLRQATLSLARLKSLIENEVATGAKVRIGFSDNDGD